MSIENGPIVFFTKCRANDTFLNALEALIPKIPFSFFAEFWAWVTSGAPGSVLVGFGEAVLLGVLARGLYRPPPPPPGVELPPAPGLQDPFPHQFNELPDSPIPCRARSQLICHGHGACRDGRSNTGVCDCERSPATGYWAGVSGACDDCALGYYGNQCTLVCLPVTEPGNPCYGGGVCDSGRLGNGTCYCDAAHAGEACETECPYFQVVFASWSPLVLIRASAAVLEKPHFSCCGGAGGVGVPNFPQFPAIFRNFPQFPAISAIFRIFPAIAFCWSPLRARWCPVCALCRGVALEASGGLATAPQFPRNFPQFFAMGFGAPRPQSRPPPAAACCCLLNNRR